ncbi:MAG TPA: SpoIID/LytB domain-containing protein [Acidimicrobiia bacterium]
MVPIVRLQRSIVVFATAIGLLSVAFPAMADIDDWEFEGGGWGHGVGLSQYGTLAQAQDGRNATQILQFYYTGTSIASVPGTHWTTQPNKLLVGLVSNATTVILGAVGGPLTICQPATTCPPVSPPNEPRGPAGFADVTIDPGETWRFERFADDPNKCRFRKTDPVAAAGNLGWGPCNAKLTKAAGTTVRYVVNGKEYARGELRFTDSTAGFHAVAALDLEQYLYGLAEVPSSWPSEALKAQAIIGRSYAVATAVDRGGASGSTTLSSCGCHLKSTTADQVYAGWSKEVGGAAWVSAVDATAGDIITHPQSTYALDIAKAFYSSSNGGASEDNEDVWGAPALPWLRSVEDPWSVDPVNPLAHWTILVNTANVATYLGWDKMYTGQLIAGPPGAIVRFNGKDGGVAVTTDLNGTQVRALLNAYGFRADGQPVRVSPYISAVTDPPGFNDIDGNIFEDAIKWMAFEEITMGCNPPTNTLYCPNANVTRGEMAVFISRAMGLPAPKGDHFTDDTGEFYEGAANRLYEAGITQGCGPNRYCGGQNIPREQMAAFLARTLALPNSSIDHFIDDENSQFEGAIDKIAAAGITLGCNPPTNNRFCPKDLVTRGQMAAFFKRAWGS